MEQGLSFSKASARSTVLKVWGPKIDHDAAQVCKSCHGCQVVGELCAPEPMQWVEPPSGPWQDVTIDVLGPLPSGENLLVLVATAVSLK